MGILGILYIWYFQYRSILPVGVLTRIQVCQEKGWAVTLLHRWFLRYQLPTREKRLMFWGDGDEEIEHPATLFAYNMMDYDNGHNATCLITSSLLY